MIITQIEKINTSEKLQKTTFEVKKQNKTIGFVPTMGALHQGHLKLVKKAKAECDFVVVSIFVNPTQFNNQEDFNNYPDTIENDLIILNNYADVVFTPKVSDIYENEFLKDHAFEGLENVMEGPNRPGHFKGVANVVDRLLKIVKADKAYFGEKDFQQLAIINKLVEKEKIQTKIIPVATERNDDGLALSSRNIRLSETGLKKASLIYKSLLAIKEDFKKGKDIQKTQNQIIINLEKKGFKVEYLEVREQQKLTLFNPKKTNVLTNKFRVFIVAWLEGVRLIDNIKL